MRAGFGVVTGRVDNISTPYLGVGCRGSLLHKNSQGLRQGDYESETHPDYRTNKFPNKQGFKFSEWHRSLNTL